ncbi:hypothetical protein EMPS_01537 [Entomortierella parvispora]|uniref:Yeast cell wall synthesis Kre9/Knh1-like N-terminal domain-containing protein n=1 Tax=Entomortierella parvispora TaxID=205924 RepID=A0A9P3LSN2_9FUNG|nr:hypothetical protein EMPS_01537 [Entomortierella parvispora]
MHLSIATFSLSLIGAALAQQAFPIAPVAETVWTSGGAATVQWKLNPPAVKTGLDVELYKGDPAHQTLVSKLGTGAPGGTSLKVTIPPKLNSDWYSVRVGDSYSHYFIIKGVGAAPTGPAPTSGSNATSSITAPTATSSRAVTSTPSTTATTKAASGALSGYTTSEPLAMFAAAAVVALTHAF